MYVLLPPTTTSLTTSVSPILTKCYSTWEQACMDLTLIDPFNIVPTSPSSTNPILWHHHNRSVVLQSHVSKFDVFKFSFVHI